MEELLRGNPDERGILFIHFSHPPSIDPQAEVGRDPLQFFSTLQDQYFFKFQEFVYWQIIQGHFQESCSQTTCFEKVGVIFHLLRPPPPHNCKPFGASTLSDTCTNPHADLHTPLIDERDAAKKLGHFSFFFLFKATPFARACSHLVGRRLLESLVDLHADPHANLLSLLPPPPPNWCERCSEFSWPSGAFARCGRHKYLSDRDNMCGKDCSGVCPLLRPTSMRKFLEV